MVILGSQSPRRRELLSLLVAADEFRVVPPLSDDEPGFDDCESREAIRERLMQIVDQKLQDVRSQVENLQSATVLCADTIVVVERDNRPLVLGKPPAEDWEPIVKNWFEQYYLGKTHEVWTGLAMCATGNGEDSPRTACTVTKVTMRTTGNGLVERYLATGEPVGKAGGYAIQGAGSMFVDKIEGSLTNVVGLPLEVVSEWL